MLVRITAPHMCAGFVRGEGQDRYADILAWMRTKSLPFIRAWCQKKGYKFEQFTEGSKYAVVSGGEKPLKPETRCLLPERD